MAISWDKNEKILLEALRATFSTSEIKRVFSYLGYSRSEDAIWKMSRKLGISFKEVGVPVINNLSSEESEAIAKVIEERAVYLLNILDPPVPETTSQKGQITTQKKAALTGILAELGKIRKETIRTSSLLTYHPDTEKMSLVLVLSDWHMGEIVVDPQSGEVLYNMEIAEERIARSYGLVVSALGIEKISQIDECVICLIGDIVTGEGIYPHQEISLQDHALQQTLRATRAIWQLIEKLKLTFPCVRIITTKGNHGRTDHSPEANWDNVVYQELELLIDLESDVNLTIKNRYGDFNSVDIKGWKGLLRHSAPSQTETAGGAIKYAGWSALHDWDFFCFLPGTKVITLDGTHKLIEDISLDTKLLGRDGEEVSIKEVHPVRNVEENVYKFKVEGLTSEYLPGSTGEHPFYIVKDLQCRLPSRKDRRCNPDRTSASYPCSKCEKEVEVNPNWVMAKNIEVGDFIAIPYPQIPSKPLEYTDGLAKLLGYYLAEGHILKDCSKKPCRGNLRGVCWSFNEEETELIEDVRYLVKKHFNLDLHLHFMPGSKEVQCLAHGKEIAEFFQKHGGEYSHSKKLSLEVWNYGFKDRMELLDGYLLGDGHNRIRRISSREYTGSSASFNLISQLYLLGLSCKLRPILRIDHPELKETSLANYPQHIIGFYGESAELLVPEGNRNEKARTKVNGFFYQNMYYAKISEIESFPYKGPVYNISTSTKEYVAGHVLTHNCLGHWHHWGVNEFMGKPIYRNGSLVGTDEYSESLAKSNNPVQICFLVSHNSPCEGLFTLKY